VKGFINSNSLIININGLLGRQIMGKIMKFQMNSTDRSLKLYQHCIVNMCLLIALIMLKPAYADNANATAYNFNFDEFLTWSGHTASQAVDHGVYLEEFAPDEWGVVLKSESRANRTITYNNHLALNNVYELTFKARIDSYAAGVDDSYPLRVSVKNGTHALIIYFREDGVFYDANSGVVKLTDAVSIGQWKNYHLEYNDGEAKLFIDNGNALSITGILENSSATAIQLSARGDRFTTSQSTVDKLRLAPERAKLAETWSNLNDWATSGAGYSFSPVVNGTSSYLSVNKTGNASTLINQSINDIAKKYTLGFGLRITDWGTDTEVMNIGAHSGSHLAQVQVNKDRYIMVLNNGGSYSQNSALRRVAKNESIRLELRTIEDHAELWEISEQADTLLHAWQLPSNTDAAKITINAADAISLGGTFDVLYVNYTDEVLVDEAPPFGVGARVEFANGESFGVSHYGGGYGANFKLTPTGNNILGAGFGAGWVSALRSNMHNTGDYNPTQAGTADHMGAPTKLTKSTNSSGGDVVTIESVVTPLFMLETKTYDWQQNEPIKNSDGTNFSDKNGQDGGNSDIDGLYEKHLQPEDELRSEMNFTGLWEDVTSLATTGNSILRHYARWEYKRNPDAILQFNAKSNGIDENWRVNDLSPQVYANSQTPTDIDLSYLLNTYSIRLLDNQGYKYFMWKEDGQWQAVLAENNVFYHVGVVGTDSVNDPAMNADARGNVAVKQANLGVTADINLMVISKTASPTSPDAVGLYFPWDSDVNLSEVQGFNRDESSITPVFSENRNINSYFSVSLRTNKWMTIFLRMWHLGLRAPDHDDGDVYETLQNEYYHVVGTPNEIFATVSELKQAL
jgi:hypothetical protein